MAKDAKEVTNMAEYAIRPRSGKTVIGIDVGGSTTKIVGFTPEGELIAPQNVKATDPVTSAYGAFGKFTLEHRIKLDNIDRVNMTGVGSAFISEPIYSLPCCSVGEFDSIGIGGLYLSGLSEAIVVSMGTGTAITYAKRTGDSVKTDYLGGTGVGGGTITGLSKKLLGIDSVRHLEEYCRGGNLANVDLRICDISRPDTYPDMNADLTASNFGKISDLATGADIAAGIFNMVAETVAMMSIFASRKYSTRDIVLIGNLTNIRPICDTFAGLAPKFNVNFIVPELSGFGTVIGAALQ